jgi:hypothetical protein
MGLEKKRVFCVCLGFFNPQVHNQHVLNVLLVFYKARRVKLRARRVRLDLQSVQVVVLVRHVMRVLWANLLKTKAVEVVRRVRLVIDVLPVGKPRVVRERLQMVF